MSKIFRSRLLIGATSMVLSGLVIGCAAKKPPDYGATVSRVEAAASRAAAAANQAEAAAKSAGDAAARAEAAATKAQGMFAHGMRK